MSAAARERLDEWRAARFGMFIHWGPVSLTEKEISWSRANSNPQCPNKGPTPIEVYDTLYKRFNPTKFDPAQWVTVAKAAGMKYMILTATYALVRKLQPKVVLTNRLDLGEGNNDRQILSPQADYYTPEQSVGAYDDERPWESCMTISRRSCSSRSR